MNSLLPPSASLGQRAQEAATARVGDVPVPLRDLWHPATCPAALLPWLAWALSVDVWKSNWPESVKRSRLAAAIDIQRHKGTLKSVQDVVRSFGGDITLHEWWQTTPAGTPHTFTLDLVTPDGGGAVSSAQWVDDIIAAVTSTKPLRSHFTFTQGVAASAQAGLFAAARAALFRRLDFRAL